MKNKEIKKIVLEALSQESFQANIEKILNLPLRKVINPLFSFLYSHDEKIKWNAVKAMGIVVSKIADTDIESSRIVMRRLIWNLNDESGGIGWGSPEAMGEIIANNEILAKEYVSILKSYIIPDQNFLEHEGLQEGVLWAIIRISETNSKLVSDILPFITTFLTSKNIKLKQLAELILN